MHRREGTVCGTHLVFVPDRVYDLLLKRSVLTTQALWTWIFVCLDSLLLDHTLCVSLDMVVNALPMLLFSSVSRERASEMVEPRYMKSWMSSNYWLVIPMSDGWSMLSC